MPKSAAATKNTDGALSGKTSRSRRQELLEAAARHFLKNGFSAASMRDIADEAQMKPASIYYHFQSKADLFVEVHKVGLNRIKQEVEEALEGAEGGWERLLVACKAHLRALLEGDIFFQAVMHETPRHYSAEERARVIIYRDAYEAIFVKLLDEIDFPLGTDRHDLRLMLLGAMNWSFTWYRPGRQTPDMLAEKFVNFLKHELTKDN